MLAWKLPLAAAVLATVALACAPGAPSRPTATAPSGASATPTATLARSPSGGDVGAAVPDFTLVNVATGQTVTRADLLDRRRPYVLYFFATW